VVYTYNVFKPTVGDSLSHIFTKLEFARAAREFGFSASATPTQLALKHWLGLFELATRKRQKLDHLVDNYEELLATKHMARTKMHRTR